MHRFQYYKVASCTPDVFIGDPDANKKEILNIIHSLDSDTQLAVFPELCISGYTCQDLFYEDILLKRDIDFLNKMIMNKQYKERTKTWKDYTR